VLSSDTGERNRVLWAAAFLAGVVPITVLRRLGIVASSLVGSPSGDHADMNQKERAISRATPPNTTQGRYRPPDPLLAFLDSL
jgi:hypothetical protein